ncbi:hypothetical protein TrST_g9973 [Triparma strigata]|uniref:Glucosyltransferase 24 catalytic domain-containing protein n=1 Tax=Triparma strigata TaxID=1606541 RepID=A0A9W7BDK3_9STRA|nr:hypothetical protein TrST_g9973 [Triparma strigata]
MYEEYKSLHKLIKDTELNNLNSHYYTSDCSVYVNGLPVKHICGGNDLGGESMVVGQSKSDGIGLPPIPNPVRYDVARGLQNYTFWLNDVEKDTVYKSLNKHTIQAYMEGYGNVFPGVRRNLINVIVGRRFEGVYEILGQYPVRVGVYFGEGDEGELCFLEEMREGGFKGREVNKVAILGGEEERREYAKRVGIDYKGCEGEEKLKEYLEVLKSRNIEEGYAYVNGRRVKSEMKEIVNALSEEVMWIREKIMEKKITDSKPRSVLGWVTKKGVKGYLPPPSPGSMKFSISLTLPCTFNTTSVLGWEYDIVEGKSNYVEFYGSKLTFSECVTSENVNDIITVYGNNITHYNTFLNGSSPLLKTWLTYISSSSPSTLHNLLSPRYSPIKSHPSQLTSYPTIPPTLHNLTCYIDPISISSQRAIQACELVGRYVSTTVFYVPKLGRGRYNEGNCPVKRYYSLDGTLNNMNHLLSLSIDVPSSVSVRRYKGAEDFDSLRCEGVCEVGWIFDGVILGGQGYYGNGTKGGGEEIQVWNEEGKVADTRVMDNLGYWQVKVQKKGRYWVRGKGVEEEVVVNGLEGEYVFLTFKEEDEKEAVEEDNKDVQVVVDDDTSEKEELETINVFSVATGHLYERFLKIMMLSLTQSTKNPVHFYLLDTYLSPGFREEATILSESLNCKVTFVSYKWPPWLRSQSTIQRRIWGYKILFLDVLFPQNLKKIIFVDADQVMREDIRELWEFDLQGEVYGYVPFCDSNADTLGFQFWREGYWKDLLGDKPYHISALYVVDLEKFRDRGVGDILRATYESLSRDPNSLSNLDQDLPNFVSNQVPIFSLPQSWLWCESWCSLETKVESKTIDLCNNPLKKEPKIDMARRIIKGELFEKSWEEMDEEVKARIGDGLVGRESHDEL